MFQKILALGFVALAAAANVARQLPDSVTKPCIDKGVCPEGVRNSTCLTVESQEELTEECMLMLCKMEDLGDCTKCLEDDGGISGWLKGVVYDAAGSLAQLACTDGVMASLNATANATTSASGDGTKLNGTTTGDGTTTGNGTNSTAAGGNTTAAPGGDGSGTKALAPALAFMLAVAGAATLA